VPNEGAHLGAFVRLGRRYPRAMFDHVWHWRSRLPERKGTACRVVARSHRLGSVLVEFEDGFRVVTSRYAVRRQSGLERG